MITLQHNIIKVSFKKSLHMVNHVTSQHKKTTRFLCQNMHCNILRKKNDRVKYVELDKVFCELTSYDIGTMSLHLVDVHN